MKVLLIASILGFAPFATANSTFPEVQCKAITLPLPCSEKVPVVTLIIKTLNSSLQRQVAELSYDVPSQCFGRPFKGNFTAEIYSRDSNDIAILDITEEAKTNFFAQVPDFNGQPFWEALMYTGIENQNFLKLNNTESSVKISLASYNGVTLDVNNNVVPNKDFTASYDFECE